MCLDKTAQRVKLHNDELSDLCSSEYIIKKIE